jgi:hypothetical protein
MAKQNEHGRLIAAAAKAALAPLGCKRKGQSRFWYSDQGFWIISIEFQPSGWAAGSYLNVGPHWIWHRNADWGFSEDSRVEDIGFAKFENAEQFRTPIAAMAARAAREVWILRNKFKSLDDIYAYLLSRTAQEGWPVYDAAVAAGLVGDMATSAQLFNRLADWPTSAYDWQRKIKANGAGLARLIDHPAEFRLAVLAIITDVRNRLHLPSDPRPFRTTDSIAAR